MTTDPYASMRGDDYNPQTERIVKYLIDHGVNPHANRPYMGPDIGPVSAVQIEKLRLQFVNAITIRLEEDFKTFRHEEEIDWMTHSTLHKFIGYFWSHRIDKKRIEHPMTWLDAVKIRFLPERLLKRFPPRYMVHNIDYRYVYPGLKIRDVAAEPFMLHTEFTQQANPQYFKYPTTEQLNPYADPPDPRRFIPGSDYDWFKDDEK